MFGFGVFSDSLLAVGAYQIGQYFRDRYRDQLLGSGDTYPLLKDKRQILHSCAKRGGWEAIYGGWGGIFAIPVATSCCAEGWYEERIQSGVRSQRED